jgi:two-component system cell cycle response regulator
VVASSEGSFRILVVDDEPAIREFMAIAFGEEGYAVQTAASGEEAMRILTTSGPVQAVFTDIRMPGMNGVELLRRIRHTWNETEVVIMTSDATVDTAVAAIREGAYDYLLKPVEDVEVLLALARRVKTKRDLVDELRAKNAALGRLAAEMAALQDWNRRLALSLDAEILHKTAVDGLAMLAGGRIAVLYTLPDPRSKLSLTASTGPAPSTLELPWSAADVPGGRNGFGALGEWDALVTELAARHHGPLAALHPLIVGGEPYGFLATFGFSEGKQHAEAAPGTIAQFVAAVSTALGNALLYRSVAEATLKDGLTGLYNHRYFQERLAAEIARAERGNKPLTLLFFDIDHFKALNDAHGHPVGDRVLAGVAEILRNSTRVSDAGFKLRQGDIAARYGGEEFVLILPETSREDGQQKAERLRLAIEAYPFPGRETQPGGAVTVSVGLSEYPRDATDAKGVIEAADNALYRAKRNGRNQVMTADAPPQRSSGAN